MFEASNFNHDASFEGATFTGLARFDRSHFRAKARFDGAIFGTLAQFQAAIFDGPAIFTRTTFTDAWFDGATFVGPADFELTTVARRVGFMQATFAGFARFEQATFKGDSLFDEATFNGSARFGWATFAHDAGFAQATFKGFAAFDRAKFEGFANFSAIKADSVFSLASAAFLEVPDFLQAHFAEAPRLDDARIQQKRRVWPTTLARLRQGFKGDPDRASRWRALKRLAIQGHDHAREQAFFKGELKARRWSEDKPWHAVFWFSVFYQLLSDFGRSIWRPLAWWGASVLYFASIYLGQHPVLAKTSSSGVSWAYRRLSGSGGGLPPLTCVAGSGEPGAAALNLSLHKGLVFLGLIPVSKLNQIHACLYGIHTGGAAQPSQLPTSFSPVIPDAVTFLGFIQHALSAVLIFLFLLAIRNHFRIK